MMMMMMMTTIYLLYFKSSGKRKCINHCSSQPIESGYLDIFLHCIFHFNGSYFCHYLLFISFNGNLYTILMKFPLASLTIPVNNFTIFFFVETTAGTSYNFFSTIMCNTLNTVVYRGSSCPRSCSGSNSIWFVSFPNYFGYVWSSSCGSSTKWVLQTLVLLHTFIFCLFVCIPVWNLQQTYTEYFYLNTEWFILPLIQEYDPFSITY